MMGKVGAILTDSSLIARVVHHLAQVPDRVLTPEYIAIEFANRLRETNPEFNWDAFVETCLTHPQRDECSHGVRWDLCPDCSEDSCTRACPRCGGHETEQRGHGALYCFTCAQVTWTDEEPRNHSHNAGGVCPDGETDVSFDAPRNHSHNARDVSKPLTIYTWNDYEEQGSERYQGEPRVHSHNASCYMLGQRTVSYRTCGKLEGEPLDVHRHTATCWTKRQTGNAHNWSITCGKLEGEPS